MSVVPAGMATVAAVSTAAARAAFNRDRQGGFNRGGQGRPQGGFNRTNNPSRPAAPRPLRHPLRKEEPSNASAEESQVSPRVTAAV